MLEAMKWMTERAKYVLDLTDRAADHMFPHKDNDANIKMVTTLFSTYCSIPFLSVVILKKNRILCQLGIFKPLCCINTKYVKNLKKIFSYITFLQQIIS